VRKGRLRDGKLSQRGVTLFVEKAGKVWRNSHQEGVGPLGPVKKKNVGGGGVEHRFEVLENAGDRARRKGKTDETRGTLQSVRKGGISVQRRVIWAGDSNWSPGTRRKGRG